MNGRLNLNWKIELSPWQCTENRSKEMKGWQEGGRMKWTKSHCVFIEKWTTATFSSANDDDWKQVATNQ